MYGVTWLTEFLSVWFTFGGTQNCACVFFKRRNYVENMQDGFYSKHEHSGTWRMVRVGSKNEA